MAEDVGRPIIVTALFGDGDFRWLDDQRRAHFPPARNHLAAHLTLFHHLPPSCLPELKQRLSAATRRQPAPLATIAGVISLGGGVAYRVDSAGLAAIRADLADAFLPLLTPQDRAGWRAHVTIQNKVPVEAARQLKAAIDREFSLRPLAIAGLAAWAYEGGPWSALSRHMFG